MKTTNHIKLYITILLIGLFQNSFSQECLWSCQGGGAWEDFSISLTCSPNGEQYITGTTLSSICYFNTDSLMVKGVSDIFLVKYDVSGNEVWIKQYGSKSDQDGESSGRVVFDPIHQRVLLCGTFIGDLKLQDTTLWGTGRTGFLLSMDPEGNLLWARAVVRANADWGHVRFFGLTYDESGNVYLSGCNVQPVNFDGIVVPAGGFLAKYNRDGNILWAKNKFRYWSQWPVNPSYPYTEAPPYNMTCKNNQLYINGYTMNDTIIIDTLTINMGLNISAYVAVFNLEGELTRFTYSGGPKCFSGNQITVNDQGTAYITGLFEGTKAVFGKDTLLSQTSHGECYISKINSSGEFVWTKQMFADDQTYGQGLALDGSGNVYLSGFFRGSIRCGEEIVMAGSNSDMFLAKFSTEGNCIGIRKYSAGVIPEITIDNNGNICMVGKFINDLQIGPNTFTSRGMSDIFAAKCSPITGIAQPEETVTNRLLIYANPTTGMCNVTIPEEFQHEKGLTLKIYDHTGRLIQETMVDMMGEAIRLDIRAQAKGLYHAVLSNGEKSFTGKVVFE